MKNILFTSRRIGSTTIKNRFIRSATWENLCKSDGSPSEKLFSSLKQLADGDVGLIVPGFAFPSYDSVAYTGQLGLVTREQAEVWAPTIRHIHSKHSKLFFQVCHCGSRTQPQFIGNHTPKGASGIIEGSQEMTNKEIEEAISNIIASARLCKIAGADGVQLHAAHGYLLSEFLSPAFNRRTDKWGGENRIRIVKEIVQGIKKEVELPISLKINGHDCVEGGVTPEIAASYILQLPEVDMFEISCGFNNLMTTIRSRINETKRIRSNKYFNEITKKADPNFPYKDGYNVEYAKEIRKIAPDAVLAVVGGNRNFGVMTDLIIEGVVDFVSMARPFIRQPFLIRDYQDALTMMSDCSSCGACIIDAPEKEGKEVFCQFTH